MIIVPVIDLLKDRAVLARQGRRSRYRPIDSPLCRDGDPIPLVARLHDEFGCTTLYFADLDAILGHGDHWPLLARIAQRFPALTMWVDGGFDHPSTIEAARGRTPFRPVVGSESWQAQAPAPADSLLSIDLDATGLRDPSGLAADRRRHPRDLILMNLTRVGSDAGPDLSLMQQFVGNGRSDTRLFLAGGTRNLDDLLAARNAGAAGVLIASALHNGRIGAADLAAFN